MPLGDDEAPPAWRRFLAGVERRSGASAEELGYLALALRYMTAEEQDRAERMLMAYREEAEAGELDIPLDSWAALRLADTWDGKWWRCVREGCTDRILLERRARFELEQGRYRRSKGADR